MVVTVHISLTLSIYLWISSSDSFILLLTWVGTISSLCGVYFGAHPAIMFVTWSVSTNSLHTMLLVVVLLVVCSLLVVGCVCLQKSYHIVFLDVW